MNPTGLSRTLAASMAPSGSARSHESEPKMEVDDARESEAGRKVSGYRASQRGRKTDEAVQPNAWLSHGCGLFARILLTEGCSPVGELRGAFATGAGRELLPTRGRVGGRSGVDARGPAGAGRDLPVPLRPRAQADH